MDRPVLVGYKVSLGRGPDYEKVPSDANAPNLQSWFTLMAKPKGNVDDLEQLAELVDSALNIVKKDANEMVPPPLPSMSTSAHETGPQQLQMVLPTQSPPAPAKLPTTRTPSLFSWGKTPPTK